MRKLTWIVGALGLLALAAGGGPDAWAAKGGGGGGGKPGGGGGGGGGTTAPLEIVYTAFEGAWLVGALAVDGSGSSTLVGSTAIGTPADPSWSPLADRMVFCGEANGQGLYICDADGSNVTKLWAGTAFDPQWSPTTAPDGKEWVLFTVGDNGGDLHVVDPATGDTYPLNSPSGRSEFYACWSPDGDQIAVGANDSGGILPRKIVLLNVITNASGDLELDLDSQVVLLDDADGEYFDFAWMDWSRDGTRIAFSGATQRDGERDIFTVAVDTGAVVNVTANLSGGCRWPTWSPDSSEIAFYRSGKGKDGEGVQIMSSDGTGDPTHLGTKGARALDWRRISSGQ